MHTESRTIIRAPYKGSLYEERGLGWNLDDVKLSNCREYMQIPFDGLIRMQGPQGGPCCPFYDASVLAGATYIVLIKCSKGKTM